MKSVVYSLGLLLLIVGAASGVAEIFFVLAEGSHRSLAVGVIWYRVHAGSLHGLREMIEASAGPVLWTPVHVFLNLPAWAVFLVPGLVILLTMRDRPRY